MKRLFFNGYKEALNICKERYNKNLKTKIFTPNAEMFGDPKKSRILRHGDLLIPDGIGVYIGAKLVGLSPVERTNGIDFAEKLIKLAQDEGLSIFLLGGRPQIATQAAIKLTEKNKGLKITGTHHGYFEKSGIENRLVLNKIDASNADILFVCLGFPEQEKWICRNLPKLKNVKIAVGLGGSLDVWSGAVERAPLFVRKIGLEWLWRVSFSPSRICRLPKLFNFIIFCFLKKME